LIDTRVVGEDTPIVRSILVENVKVDAQRDGDPLRPLQDLSPRVGITR